LPAASPWLLTMPVATGVGFALIAIAYRLGQTRGVGPPQIVLLISVAGAVYFGVAAWPLDLAGLPPLVLAFGVVAGLGQYLGVKLIRPILDRGPLSPLWCAMSLYFLPASLYAYLVWGERIRAHQYAAIAAAVACVVIASIGQGRSAPSESDHARPDRPVRRKILYGLMLVGVLIFNSLMAVCIKDLGTRPAPEGGSYMDHHGHVMYLLFYVALGAAILPDLLITRAYRVPLRSALLLGLLGSAGSIGGLMALRVCAAYPAGVVFTIAGVTSILTVAVVSVLALGEKADATWYGTVATGVLAVILANLSGFGIR
jgi:hypothetical protein